MSGAVKTRVTFYLLFTLSSLPANACECASGLSVFGVYELATLHSVSELPVKALVDSGATTSALDARNIKMHVNRSGERWVYYDFVHKATAKKISMRQPVSRVVRIITHSGPPVARPVIKGTVSVGTIKRKIEMSLINRSNFPQQLLIGRNYLKNTALIDSGKQFLQSGN